MFEVVRTFLFVFMSFVKISVPDKLWVNVPVTNIFFLRSIAKSCESRTNPFHDANEDVILMHGSGDISLTNIFHVALRLFSNR